jgi:hypothetical protein
VSNFSLCTCSITVDTRNRLVPDRTGLLAASFCCCPRSPQGFNLFGRERKNAINCAIFCNYINFRPLPTGLATNPTHGDNANNDDFAFGFVRPLSDCIFVGQVNTNCTMKRLIMRCSRSSLLPSHPAARS